MDEQTDIYKTSRGMYVAEAAVEYFISMIVTGAYLAKVTTAIGISDGLTGILTSFVSLGCGFQIIAIFLANRRPVKRWVTALHSLNQLFFALIYLVPFMRVPQTVQIAIFVVFFLLGHVLNNVVNSPKINWFMSLVDDKRRGRFTALKESVSLIGGMLFSFGVGAVIDAYEAAGNLNGAFIFCGVGIFVLMLLHTGTLLLSKEKLAAEEEKIPVRKLLGELIRDKGLLKVIMISVLWNVAHYVTTPFYGTYQIGELGFTMTFVSLLSVLYAVVRTLFSRPLGKFADKRSFTQMMKICFIIAAAGFCVNAFTVPANGKVLYTIYYLLYAVGMAGINSGEINPFTGRWSWHLHDFRELDAVSRALAFLKGTHDFSTFSVESKKYDDPVRSILRAELYECGPLKCIHFIGDGFLYKMVRSMVGVLAEIGRGRIAPEIIPEMLDARSRCAARDTAPARGLFLMKVFYENREWEDYVIHTIPWMELFPAASLPDSAERRVTDLP